MILVILLLGLYSKHNVMA